MHVAVIGAGIVGVTTAYYLRQQGFEVTVVERRPGVAQEASFAHAGLVTPAAALPWAQPGMPARLLRGLLDGAAPFVFRPRLDAAQWRWLARWAGQCRPDRLGRNKERMQRLALYSRDCLHALRQHHAIDYEQTDGHLQLFRSEREVERTAPIRLLLKEAGIPHTLLDAAGCRRLEPALAEGAPLAGGLHLPEDETGNGAYFARRLKDICSEHGVRFCFDSIVDRIETEGDCVRALRLRDRSLAADAVVVAAGVDSAALLRAVGVRLPLYPVKGYSATAAITRPEEAPMISVTDASYGVAVTRMGNRLRIAGIAELGSRALMLRDAALGTLLRVARDWFPRAAAYRQARFWVGARPMLPDGAPILGATPIAGLFLNVGHGSSGWTNACGAARVVTDLIAARAPEIALDGLTLDRCRSRTT